MYLQSNDKHKNVILCTTSLGALENELKKKEPNYKRNKIQLKLEMNSE